MMPMNQPLNNRRIAALNISQKPVRSVSLILLVTLFAFVLSAGALFMNGLAHGVRSMAERLGADVMVVPSGYKADIESVLLKGEPSTFYLPDGALETLRQVEGIDRLSPQLYVATLSASCCSYPVQIIGIDPETDFLIQPWLREHHGRDLKDGEALVGANIVGEAGDTVHFFDQLVHIGGRLEQTGMGFDATVFVNMNTAKALAKASERMGANPASEGDRVSCVMIKAKPDVDAVKLAGHISNTYGDAGLFAMFSKRFVNDISGNLTVLSRLIGIAVAMIWVLSVGILGLTFSAMMHERRREMSVLKMLGATRRRLAGVVLREAFTLCLYGGLIGSLLGAAGGLIWAPLIGRQINIPFQSLSAAHYALVILASLALSLLIGPLASLPAVRKVQRREAYVTLRDEA